MVSLEKLKLLGNLGLGKKGIKVEILGTSMEILPKTPNRKVSTC